MRELCDRPFWLRNDVWTDDAAARSCIVGRTPCVGRLSGCHSLRLHQRIPVSELSFSRCSSSRRFLSYFGLIGSWLIYLHPIQGSLLLTQAAFDRIENWQWWYSVLYSILWIGIVLVS